MTKYVVNSGGVRKYPESAKKFFAEVFRDLRNTPKLLICCFAQPREDWEEKFKEDQNTLPAFFPPDIQVSLELAFPDTFKEQIKNSDAVYLHGGDDNLILYWLKQFDLPKIWDEKVVATGSASSNALSKYFWTPDWRKNMDGLGILPVKFISHYESDYGQDDPRGPVDWEVGYKQLEIFGDPSLPIHALHEGEFVVIER